MEGQPEESFWRRRRKALLFGLAGLVCLCAAAGYVAVTVTSAPVVTAAQQQIAQGAIYNSAGATLHLGHLGDIQGWFSAGPTDYAVQDGMVIFPAPAGGISLFHPKYPIGDLTKSVLVYAPDGSDLSSRPHPTNDRGWFYFNEWFLYDCRATATPMWWGCTLLVGFNI